MGRTIGAKNKVSKQAKDDIEEAFVKLGGVNALLEWAKRHPSEFYTKIFPKILTLSTEVSGANGTSLFSPEQLAKIQSLKTVE